MEKCHTGIVSWGSWPRPNSYSTSININTTRRGALAIHGSHLPQNNLSNFQFSEPLCHQCLAPFYIRLVSDILRNSFCWIGPNLEEVSAEYDDRQATKASILKSTEDPQFWSRPIALSMPTSRCRDQKWEWKTIEPGDLVQSQSPQIPGNVGE